MRLSNFELIKTEGQNTPHVVFFAMVDVTTGILWWRKKYRTKIRRKFTDFWHFVDTGRYTPGIQAENLARSWEAKTGDEI